MKNQTENSAFIEMVELIKEPNAFFNDISTLFNQIIDHKKLTFKDKADCLQMITCGGIIIKTVIYLCDHNMRTKYLNFLIKHANENTVNNILDLLREEYDIKRMESYPTFFHFQKEEMQQFLVLLSKLLDNGVDCEKIFSLIIFKRNNKQYTISDAIDYKNTLVVLEYIHFIEKLIKSQHDFNHAKNLFTLAESYNTYNVTLAEKTANRFEQITTQAFIHLLVKLLERSIKPDHIIDLLANYSLGKNHKTNIHCQFAIYLAYYNPKNQLVFNFHRLLYFMLDKGATPKAVFKLISPQQHHYFFNLIRKFVYKDRDPKLAESYLDLLIYLITRMENEKAKKHSKEDLAHHKKLISNAKYYTANNWLVDFKQLMPVGDLSKHSSSIYKLFDNDLLEPSQYKYFINLIPAITDYILHLSDESKIKALKNVLENRDHPLYTFFRLSYTKTAYRWFGEAKVIQVKPDITIGELKLMHEELTKLEKKLQKHSKRISYFFAEETTPLIENAEAEINGFAKTP